MLDRMERIEKQNGGRNPDALLFRLWRFFRIFRDEPPDTTGIELEIEPKAAPPVVDLSESGNFPS